MLLQPHRNQGSVYLESMSLQMIFVSIFGVELIMPWVLKTVKKVTECVITSHKMSLYVLVGGMAG